MSAYRPNSALILQKPDGRVLLAERIDVAGAWQFPQGGGKKQETPLETLHREVEEELGLPAAAYEVMLSRGPYRYDFPTGRIKEGFRGQEQTYFLARLLDENLLPAGPVRSEEFRAIRWIAPAEFDSGWVPEFKREVYRRVLADFFGIRVRAPGESCREAAAGGRA
jgi:putative (di)nucleoside polyphosphate hydrolase